MSKELDSGCFPSAKKKLLEARILGWKRAGSSFSWHVALWDTFKPTGLSDSGTGRGSSLKKLCTTDTHTKRED